jgi:hypothetical protein
MFLIKGDGGFGKLGHGDTLDLPYPKKVGSLSTFYYLYLFIFIFIFFALFLPKLVFKINKLKIGHVTQVACGTAHTVCVSSIYPFLISLLYSLSLTFFSLSVSFSLIFPLLSFPNIYMNRR